jgi:hypothetical protein
MSPSHVGSLHSRTSNTGAKIYLISRNLATVGEPMLYNIAASGAAPNIAAASIAVLG